MSVHDSTVLYRTVEYLTGVYGTIQEEEPYLKILEYTELFRAILDY